MFRTTTSRIRTLDPALAADVSSALAVGHLYDRLLQYHYTARPYRLIPAMAREMPEVSSDGTRYVFRLRDDLYFTPDPCFRRTPGAPGVRDGPDGPRRRVRSRDVVFSLLRLADPRVHSPGFWIFRGYLKGLDDFRAACSKRPPGDFSPYESGISGLHADGEDVVVFELTRPYPRLLHVLAMSYCSVLPEEALRFYGARIDRHPVGCGPFRLESWRRDYRIVYARNAGFRVEYYPDSTKRLPRVDRIVASVVREPLTAWLLFLQGNLDVTGLTSDNFEAVIERGVSLTPELERRGVRLLRTPQFQINYVAFYHEDPLLGRNLALRRAISLAYDVQARIAMSNNQLLPAKGPIPPGVGGYDPDLVNPWAVHDVARARNLLIEAGFPGGIDPRTGRPLELQFDLGGTDLIRRRQAEMMVADMKKIGLRIVPHLNSWPRFLDKLRRGEVQLFRVAWVGDYPDGQNFLQLFYGPNSFTCNRARYRNPKFDALYEKAEPMPDGPARTRLYRQMQRLLVDDCAWIFESYPVAFRLVQPWVSGYIPHHFAYDRWKYLDVDPRRRREKRKTFKALTLTRRATLP
ncbi:MAG: hypothetical protein GXP31_16230 [Kiritimatiellaeota bacterium]|nr:hypothetical protein [Kiritimatiellota bacterium]